MTVRASRRLDRRLLVILVAGVVGVVLVGFARSALPGDAPSQFPLSLLGSAITAGAVFAAIVVAVKDRRG